MRNYYIYLATREKVERAASQTKQGLLSPVIQRTNVPTSITQQNQVAR
jgi:hypothetical protein